LSLNTIHVFLDLWKMTRVRKGEGMNTAEGGMEGIKEMSGHGGTLGLAKIWSLV